MSLYHPINVFTLVESLVKIYWTIENVSRKLATPCIKKVLVSLFYWICMEKWIEFGNFCNLRGTAVAENTLLYVLIIVSWHNQLIQNCRYSSFCVIVVVLSIKHIFQNFSMTFFLSTTNSWKSNFCNGCSHPNNWYHKIDTQGNTKNAKLHSRFPLFPLSHWPVKFFKSHVQLYLRCITSPYNIF